MAGKIKHRFVSPVVDEGVSTEVGPNEWNDSLVVSEGADGDVFVRRTSEPDGWELRKLGAAPPWVNLADVSNSLAAETDLHSYTIPAAHFNVNGRAIRLTAWGSSAANTNTKTLRLKFGSTPVTVVLNPTQTAPNNLPWRVQAMIARTGSNAQKLYVNVQLGTAVELISTVTGAENDSNPLVLKITGQGSASGDLTIRGSMVEYLS